MRQLQEMAMPEEHPQRCLNEEFDSAPEPD